MTPFARSAASAGAAPLKRVALVGVMACSACEGTEDRTATVRSRRDAVVVTESTGRGRGPEKSSPSAATKAAPRTLCSSRPTGKPSRGPIGTAAATGAKAPVTPIPFGSGKWTWVNLWAAWCGPCKEELPRLMRWKADLRKSGVLVDFAFVAMDDDERQLQRFLESQPESGLRATYWLESEAARETWLDPFGIAVEATLPVHALVSPTGELACVIEGAVEDSDYPRLAKLFTGR